MPTEDWQDWQRAYRFGVVLIFPPEPVRSLVNELRAKYDPRSHASCEAHISLTVAAPRPLTHDALRELAAVTEHQVPLPVRYGPPMVYPSHPGVTLRIEPQAELGCLVAELEAAPPFSGSAPRRWPLSAHMTIAEFVDSDESGRIMEELSGCDLSGEFTCSFLFVAVPDADSRFTERRRLVPGRT